MDIEFVPVRGSDWDALLTLRAVTAQTMRKTGLYSEQQLANGLRELRLRFDRRTMWLALDEAYAVVGAIGLDGPDKRLWGDDPRGESALYLYKVMAVPGLGIGEKLVGFAESQARRVGRRALRLDCLRGNEALQGWWKARGFRHLRDVALPGYGAGALFEKKLVVADSA